MICSITDQLLYTVTQHRARSSCSVEVFPTTVAAVHTFVENKHVRRYTGLETSTNYVERCHTFHPWTEARAVCFRSPVGFGPEPMSLPRVSLDRAPSAWEMKHVKETLGFQYTRAQHITAHSKWSIEAIQVTATDGRAV